MLNQDLTPYSLWVTEGFANGFVTLSEDAELLYKTTDYYDPGLERIISWDEPEIDINWNLSGKPVPSAKDLEGEMLSDSELFP